MNKNVNGFHEWKKVINNIFKSFLNWNKSIHKKAKANTYNMARKGKIDSDNKIWTVGIHN